MVQAKSLSRDSFLDQEKKRFEEFVCSICHEVHLDEIVSVEKCGHIFGKHCLSKINGARKKCPTCRKRYVDSDVFAVRFAERLIKSLEVRCPCAQECTWTGKISNLLSHDCDLEPITCPVVGCGMVVPRKDMEKHRKENMVKHMKCRFYAEINTLKRKVSSLEDENKRLKRRKMVICRNDKWGVGDKVKVIKEIRDDVLMPIGSVLQIISAYLSTYYGDDDVLTGKYFTCKYISGPKCRDVDTNEEIRDEFEIHECIFVDNSASIVLE